MKKLLLLLKECYLENSRFGFCATRAFLHKLITIEEFQQLFDYMSENIPVDTFVDCSGRETDDASQFWYPIGRKEERLEWLDKHINLNS